MHPTADFAHHVHQLAAGPEYRFSDWPDEHVPAVAAGAYTIWRGAELIYGGMAGRSLTAESIMEHREDPTRTTGLRSRLASHASGRRFGNQFCVYVADRLVLPTLSRETIDAISAGADSFDRHAREYIRANLSYRFVETVDGNTARELESAVRRGALAAGPPLLNPVK